MKSLEFAYELATGYLGPFIILSVLALAYAFIAYRCCEGAAEYPERGMELEAQDDKEGRR